MQLLFYLKNLGPDINGGFGMTVVQVTMHHARTALS